MSSLHLWLLLIFVSGSNSIRVSLTGDDWSISDGQSLEATGTVPGTIHTILLSDKLIDDPYWRYHDTNLRYLVNQSWTFTKTFSLQRDFLNSTQFMLHFDQIDTVSNVTVNDCFLGNTRSMFIEYTFNVPNRCLKSDNTLRVDLMSSVIYALDQFLSYNQSYIPGNCPGPESPGECHVQFIRKEPCSFGWDWVRSLISVMRTYISIFCRAQPLHRLVLHKMYILKE